MYNRYIGNTGKFYRVDDDIPDRPASPPTTGRENRSEVHHNSSGDNRTSQHRSSLFSQPELLGNIKGLLNGILPEGMDIGDLLLILVLLLLYLEKEDEEILIILSVLIFMGFK